MREREPVLRRQPGDHHPTGRTALVGALLASLAGPALGAPDGAPIPEASLWSPASVPALTALRDGRWIAGVHQTLHLDRVALARILAMAPLEGAEGDRAAPVYLSLPLPDGRFSRFRFWNSPILAAELAAQYPEIQTYLGVAIDDPATSVRFDLTPNGFHAQILSPSASLYIDPIRKDDLNTYIAYDKRDYRRSDPPRAPESAIREPIRRRAPAARPTPRPSCSPGATASSPRAHTPESRQ